MSHAHDVVVNVPPQPQHGNPPPPGSGMVLEPIQLGGKVGQPPPAPGHRLATRGVVHDTLRNCWRGTVAEFIGTALLVFLAVGSASNTGVFYDPGPYIIAIALAFGVTIFGLSFAFGHISGGHFNPAITLPFILVRKISIIRGIMYLVAQIAGCLAGAALLLAVSPSYFDQTTGTTTTAIPNCLAANRVSSRISDGLAFLLEIIITFFFLLVVCAATDSHRSNRAMVPLAIGLAATACHLIALPLDGCGMNPARSFGPAVVAKGAPRDGCDFVFNDHWVFWIGPLIGGILGTLVYDFIFYDGGDKGRDLVHAYRYDPQYGYEHDHDRAAYYHRHGKLDPLHNDPHQHVAEEQHQLHQRHGPSSSVVSEGPAKIVSQ